MASDALRVPIPAGVNVTLMAQLAPAATLAPQVCVSAKSPAFVPANAMLETFSAAVPLLARVTFCAALVEPMF